MKIQEMAFVLVAIMIFFALIAMVYFSIRVNSLKQEAGDLRAQEAVEIVRKLSASPEFMFSAFSKECSSCIDLDKVIALKNRRDYQEFWSLDRLIIEKVYPNDAGECTLGNYPNCGRITLIDKNTSYTSERAYISLCHWENYKEGYVKCELGVISAAGKAIK